MGRVIDIPQLDGWIPVRLYWQAEGGQAERPFVDWCYLDTQRFTDPFFSQTIGACLHGPFNLLFRHQTPIEVLGRRAALHPGLKPTGFIFHMSRCGSTLVSQVLASLSSAIVISEAAPIDSTLRTHLRNPRISDELRATWLQWMVSALAQPRRGDEQHVFIKFDAWNTVDLSLIRRAFPEVPWVFLYRDPVEVMVSQFNHRGAHMVPGVIDPGLFGMNINTIAEMESDEYCAKVLATICQAALRHHAIGGMLINYKQLPQAIWEKFLGRFGVYCTEAELEKMRGTARLDAKNPAIVFSHDTAKKRQKATDAVRAAAERWLYPVYEQLEAARLSAPA